MKFKLIKGKGKISIYLLSIIIVKVLYINMYQNHLGGLVIIETKIKIYIYIILYLVKIFL